MYDKHSKDISYTAGFFMLIAFAIAGLNFASIISDSLWVEMTGKKIEALRSTNFDPADSWAFKLIQGISQLLGYFIPTVITAALLTRKPMRVLGFVKGFKLNQAGLTILIMIIALLAAAGLSYVNRLIPIPDVWQTFFDKLERNYSKLVEAIISLNSPFDLITSLFFMALLPAVCEETLFRGGLQNFLARSTKNPALAIIIVSLIFSAVHLSYYGFLHRFFLGIVLGCLYQFSGKMWPNILAHFLNNAIALGALYWQHQQGKTVNQATSETEASWWGLLAIPVVFVLLKYFKKVSAPEKPVALD